MIRSLCRRAAAVLSLVVVSLVLSPVSARADTYVPISGAGSTWSQVAVDAWRADIRASGVVVNFAGTGSTDGRSQFIQATVDFANSEIPFQTTPEPGQQAENPTRKFAYIPIVAGGTSFMYNLTVAGQRVRDLKLSGPTLAKIFTGQITRWNDPAITKDYGRALPAIPIVPVVRSDGAGASAQFAKYMISQTPSIYCPFIRSKLHLGGNSCPSVSFYPAFNGSKAQVGSNGVANYVAASYGAGAIGYVEYAYAKRIDFPVVSLLNRAGYYAQPSAGNVAVALTKAKVNPSDLTQNLLGVYTNPDPRTYPMSSYSYMIAPISTQSPFNEAKGKTLSTFVNYFLCAGQQKADKLGYSPLPKNLVEAGFQQVKRIPGYVAPPNINQCDNPALRILTTAPMPDKCTKVGATCTGTGGTGTGGTGTTGGTGNGGTGTTGGTGVPGAGATPGAPGAVDPLTGEVTTAAGGGGQAVGVATSLAAARDENGRNKALYAVSALLLALVVIVPPLLVGRARAR